MVKQNKKDHWAVSLRWPIRLYRRVKKAAKEDHRTLPKFVECVLEKHLEKGK
jgi:predicted DNA-binding protein